MNKLLGMAVAVVLSTAATICFAQTTLTTPPVSPPVATQQTPQTQPMMPAPDANVPPTTTTTTTTAPAPVPAGRNPSSPPQTAAAARSSPTASSGSCRTRKSEGDACACLKDPSTVDTAQVAPDGGKNICVVQ